MSDHAVHSLAPLLSNFLNEHLVHERGLSRHTRATYAQTFILLLRYLKEQEKMNIDVLLLENLTYEKICDFLRWIEAERGNAKSTRNLRLAVLRSFFPLRAREAPGSLGTMFPNKGDEGQEGGHPSC